MEEVNKNRYTRSSFVNDLLLASLRLRRRLGLQQRKLHRIPLRERLESRIRRRLRIPHFFGDTDEVGDALSGGLWERKWNVDVAPDGGDGGCWLVC